MVVAYWPIRAHDLLLLCYKVNCTSSKAIYYDYANVKKLKAKNIPRYQDTLITKLKILIHVQEIKVKKSKI